MLVEHRSLVFPFVPEVSVFAKLTTDNMKNNKKFVRILMLMLCLKYRKCKYKAAGEMKIKSHTQTHHSDLVVQDELLKSSR